MNNRMATLTLTMVLLITVFAGLLMGQLSETFTNWLDHPAISYKSTPTTDAVARLSRDIEDGRRQLTLDGPSGYLRSVLAALSIPVESQIAVFAKDSFSARASTWAIREPSTSMSRSRSGGSGAVSSSSPRRTRSKV